MKTRLTQFLWKWAFAIAGLCAGLFIFAKIDGFLDQAKLDFLSFPCLKVEDGRHHSMLPGCSGVLFDNGRTISFTINEDGMRDQPRKRILEQKKRVFVLGDSQVFGSRMEYSQTISSLLREKFPEWYFINGGLPFSGSLFQAKSFADSYKIYQPEKILWIVDEFFPQQDRMACALLRDPKASAEQMHFQALDLGRVPDFFLSFGDKNILLEAARGFLQRRREQEMLRSKNADRCNKCE